MRRLVGFLAVVLGLSVLAGVPSADADPQPGECEALTTAQLGDPATRIIGKTPADSEGYDCYVLPDAAGTLYKFTVLQAYVDYTLTVHDGNGARICNRPVDCRLTGAGPFTVRIGHPVDVERDYRLQILRITGANTCPPHEFGRFGSTDNLFHPDYQQHAAHCWKVEIPDGPLMHFGRSTWAIYDPQGTKLCDSESTTDPTPFHCSSNYTGPAVMTLVPSPSATEPVAVIPLKSTAGCGQAIGTSWSQPPLMLPAVDSRIDCHPISAPEGARVLPRAGLNIHFADFTMVIDSTGTPICQTPTVYQVGASLGCRLEGQPPFRLVSGSRKPFSPTDPQDYPVVVRTLNPGVDCPMVHPTRWGAAPADHHPGNGCRQFQATSGQSFVFGSVQSYEGEYGEHGAWVIDQAGKIACISEPQGDSSVFYDDQPCLDMRAGKYVVVTDPIGSDHVTMLYDRRSTDGCVPRPAGMSLVITPAAPGQIDCYRVTQPAAGVLAYYDPGNPTDDLRDEFETPSEVFRADGTDLSEVNCRFAMYCLDESEGPHRLIVGNGLLSENSFTTYTLNDLTDCHQLRRGTTDVQLDDPDKFVCVRIDKIATWREVIEMSTDGATIDSYQARQAIGGVTRCDAIIVDNMPQRALQCGPGDGSTSSLVVLLGHDTPQTVTFVRDAPAVRNRTRPRIVGRHRAGNTVRVTSGRWSPTGIRLSYQWTVDGRDIAKATKAKLRLKPRFAGHRVSVTVTGRRSEYYQDIATARAIKVRR